MRRQSNGEFLGHGPGSAHTLLFRGIGFDFLFMPPWAFGPGIVGDQQECRFSAHVQLEGDPGLSAWGDTVYA